MKLAQALTDIAEYIGIYPDHNYVRVTGTQSSATLFADYRPETVISGTMHEPIEDFAATIGISIEPIGEMLAAPNTDRSHINAQLGMESSNRQFIEILTNKAQRRYFVLNEVATNQFAPLFPRKPLEFELKLHPMSDGIEQFNYWCRVESKSSDDIWFWPAIDRRGRLHFQFEATRSLSDKMRFVFAKNISPQDIAPNAYQAGPVLKVLRLASTSKSMSMYFSNKGILKIEVDSGLGIYEYVFAGNTEVIRRKKMTAQWPHALRSYEEKLQAFESMNGDWDPEL